jgi:hypothetical protein
MTQMWTMCINYVGSSTCNYTWYTYWNLGVEITKLLVVGVQKCCSLIMVKHIKNQARIDKGDQCISSRLITLITMTLEL